jgi:hypothetical protein
VRDQKKQLTRDLVKQLDPELGVTEKVAMRTWWHNTRAKGGMRLTSVGYAVFSKDLDLAQYSFDLDNPYVLNGAMILEMDQKLQMPYYIWARQGVPRKIILFGSSEALIATLYGDFKRWLDSYQP